MYSVAIFDNSPLPFCVIRVELEGNGAPVDWTFLYCNDALAQLEGYPKEQLLGQRFFKLFPEGDRKWLKPYYEAAYEKKAAAFDSISEEIGQYLHVDCIPLDEPGVCACLLRNTKQENEYRQRLESEISAANDLHAAITTGTWRIEYDSKGARTACLWSDSFRKLLGFNSAEDFPDVWDSWFERIHPDDRASVSEHYESTAWNCSGKESYDVEYRMRTRQGEYHWFRDVAHFTRRPDGSPLYVDGILALIDEKHRTDEELRRALRDTEEMNRALQANADFLQRTEKYNRTLLDRASCGIVSYTLPERKNLYMNAEALRVYGVDSLEDGREHLSELMAGSHYTSPTALRRLKALRTQDGTVDFECVVNNRKGHSTNLVVHTEVVTSPQGERVAYTTFMDASENKSLRNEKEILNALCKDYVTVLQCDLQSDSAILLNINPGQMSPRTAEVHGILREGSTYKSILETYHGLFVDAEVSTDFTQKMSACFLMDYLPKHNDRFSYRYQLKPNPSGVKYMEVQISHFKSTEGFQVVMGFRVIDGIIQEEEQKKEVLSAALVAAERANRAKTQFLNSMSHDIRTPMNAIIGFTSLAEAHLDNEGLARDYLKKISTSSEHLLSLINDVLDMSRIESGKVKIQEKPFCLQDLLQNVRTIIQPTIDSRQLDFLVDMIDVADEDVIADELRLTQVLLNILGNGVKFNKAGGTISLRVRQEGKASNGYARYHFVIRDTGIGISKEFQDHIFESFAREESSTVSGIQGTGLGLAITKKIVDMMGGNISVKSEEGEGSEFDVCLDLKLNEQKSACNQEEHQKSSNQPYQASLSKTKENNAICFGGKKILLVEDNELNQEIALTLLKDKGFIIELAENGAVAVEKMKKSVPGQYDLVLMDVQMPVMDGYAATKAIRSLALSHCRTIPIIAMTANAFVEDQEKAIEAGMNGYQAKPIVVSELLKTIESVL